MHTVQLTEHKQNKTEVSRVAAHFERAGYGYKASPGITTETGATVAGVAVAWDADVYRCREVRTTVKGRALKIVLEPIAGGEAVTLHAAYMPDRSKTANEIEGAWRRLWTQIGSSGANEFAMMDANAEQQWARRKRGGGEPGASDAAMRTYLRVTGMIVCGDGTPTFRQKTEIDHVMAGVGRRQEVRKVEVMGGLRGKDGHADHAMVVATVKRQKEVPQIGDQRPKGQKLGLLNEEHWTEYEKEMGDWMKGQELIDGTTRKHAQDCDEDATEWLRQAQSKMIQTVQTIISRINVKIANERKAARRDILGDEDEYEPNGQRQQRRDRNGTAKPPLQLSATEHLRTLIGRWHSYKARAERYEGKLHTRRGRGSREGLARENVIRKIMENQGHTNTERKQAVMEAVDERLTKLMQRYSTRRAAPMDKIREAMRSAVADGDRGGRDRIVFKILRESTTRMVSRVGERIAAIYANDDKKAGKVIDDPEDVIAEAGRIGTRRFAAKKVNMGVVATMLDQIWGQRQMPREHGGIERACARGRFDIACGKAEKTTAVGDDGFSAYLLRRAPETVKARYHASLTTLMRSRKFPVEYSRWNAMLAMKKGEDPKELGRRRDLWVTCHAQKMIMRMIQPEYDDAVRNEAMGSQAAGVAGRGATEHVMASRMIAEAAMEERAVMCTGWTDMSSYFMSIVREVQREVELRANVDVNIMDIVHALHADAKGAYETAYGMTERFPTETGTGQGCINGGNRAVLMASVIQRMVKKYTEGANVTCGRGRVAQLWYCDDGSYRTNSIFAMQTTLECVWLVCRITGLEMRITPDGKKTAFAATYWRRGKEIDIKYTIEMPDGTPVPQVSQYKWLGFYVTGRWRGGRDTDRATAISKAKACIAMACRLPELSWDEIGETISTGLTGILGYRARGVCIRWEDAQEIEKARAAGLVQRGVICGVPRLQMYEAGAGMGHEHAYCVAAASFVDEIDRMLCGHRGAPARGVAEACIAKTCYRLGCRSAPLEWMPHYMIEELDDEMIGEAWLKIKLRAQLYAGQSGLRDSGALSSDREAWKPEVSAGPGLWESAAGTWGRRGEKATVGYGREAKRLAAIGIVQWGHVTNMDRHGKDTDME